MGKKTKHGWKVTFTNGKQVKTGYHPNPRMAVAEAIKKQTGKVKSVKYI